MSLEEDAALEFATTVPRRGGSVTVVLAPGSRAGAWVIDAVRSRGGFATVYRVAHAETHRPAALKVLHTHLAESEALILRFEREAELIRRMSHPNIVGVFELFELVDGRPAIAMEWLEGRTLDEELRSRGPMSVSEVLSLMDGLCSALQAAHGVGVVHRDLKSSNVVLVSSGSSSTVKLVDFGIAKLLGDESLAAGRAGLTSTGARLGTPHNMAPEQVLGQAVTQRTDVYALGILLYELVTGRMPFEAPTAIEIEEMQLTSPPPRASDRAPVPASLDEVIVRCMEKSQDRRYATVGDVLDALRAAVAPKERPAPGGTMTKATLDQVESCLALGLHVSARIEGDPDTIDEATLDALDELLGATRQIGVEAGMDIAIEGGSDFLAIGPLRAGDPDLESEGRIRVLAQACKAMELYAGHANQGTRVQLLIAVHVGQATFVREERSGARHYVGGELLRAADWTATHDESGVLASQAALVGLRDRVEVAPVAENSALRRILRVV